MPIYKTSDGKYYDVSQDQVESFLARNSGAVESSFDEMEKEGKRAAIYDFQGRVGVDEEKIANVPVETRLKQQAQADAEILNIAEKARAKSNVERMQEGLPVDPMTGNLKQTQIDSEWNEYYNNKIASNLQQERENLISQGKQKNNFFIIEQVSRLEDDQVKNAWVDENGQLQVGDKINPKSDPQNINDWATSVYDSSPQGPSWTEFVNEKKKEN